jgi:hypothetical protein
LALLELLVVLTVASVAYNLATAGRIKPATELYAGPFVRVGGKLVAYRSWGTSGTPIILLGGFIVPSSVWEGVGGRLGHDHRVFALTSRRSATPSGRVPTRCADGSTSCTPSRSAWDSTVRFWSDTLSARRSPSPMRAGTRMIRKRLCCSTATQSRQEAHHRG